MRRRRMVKPSPDIRESTTRLPRWRQKGQRMARVYREGASRRSASRYPAAGIGQFCASETAARRGWVRRAKSARNSRGSPRPHMVYGIVRDRRRRSALVRLDIGDDILDGADLFGILVRDLHAVFFLEGHHEFDDIERIGAEVL